VSFEHDREPRGCDIGGSRQVAALIAASSDLGIGIASREYVCVCVV
jgi:hypothetical protein